MINQGLLRLYGARMSYLGRIERSSGVIKAISTERDPFLENAFVARLPWIELKMEEIDAILSEEQFDAAHGFAIFKISEEIEAVVKNSKLFTGSNMDDLESVYSEPKYAEVTNRVLELVTKYYSRGETGNNQFLTMSLAYPDQISTAIGRYRDSNSELVSAFMGLHLDTAFDLPIKNLKNSRNRICINIGSTHRFVQIVPFSALEIANLLNKDTAIFDIDMPIQNRMDSLFLELFPSTTVYRIRLEPFEAYIAATDNFIHDGSTAEAANVDIALHLLGNFSMPQS